MTAAVTCSEVGASTATLHWDVTCSVTALSSAACEWFLILLLFLHGLLSYCLREFARYCKLPTPCLLCSRLDHYFGNKVPECYQSMFCNNHGQKIFSVMCDDCLFLCAAKKNSDSELHGLLVTKMSRTLCQPDFSISGCNEQSAFGSVDRRTCSSCGKLWTSRQNQRRSIRYRSPVRRVSKPNIPLPNEPSRKNLNRRYNMRRIREKPHGSLHYNHLRSDMTYPPANIGYGVVTVTSASESEAPFSDGSDGRITVIRTKVVRGYTSESLADAQSNILAHLKPVNKICAPANLGTDAGVTDTKMSGGVQNTSPAALPELISLDNNTSMYSPLNDLSCEATSEHAFETSPTLTSTPVMPLDNISLGAPCPSTEHIELPVKESPKQSSINGNHEHVERVGTLSMNTTFTSVEDKIDDDAPSMEDEQASYEASYVSLSLLVNNKGLKASSVAAKDVTVKIHNGAEKECHFSSTNGEYVHGTELQSNITSSRKLGDNENSNLNATHGSDECITPRETGSFERNEYAFESAAGSVVSDREGESLVDRLKRQIEYDKERIVSLYKELDEERSASAIAANQAMAMITRLQEEKASINMEALHYLRMMEEQAEYDVEALEKANDLLSEKEKEIQDLEADLEHYKSKVSVGLIKSQKSEMTCTSKDELSSNVGIGEELKDRKHSKSSNGSEYEEHKLYISECLKRLEQNLLKFTGSGATSFMCNGVISEMMEDIEQNGSQTGDDSEDNGLSSQKELHVCNGNIVEVKKPKILRRNASDKHGASDEMEANHDCCELSLESLQIGHEGLLIIEEIAHQLQELRKLVLK
ncbi:hypothetical protein QQ045_006817 [Rhodiola kirilowii]